MLFSKQQADQFFGALRAASIEFLQHHELPLDQGRKRYASWKKGYPLGVTEHYTAGVTWKGTVRWLNDGDHRNSVSCQMLILDRMLPEYKKIISMYPELSALQVVVVLLSASVIPCWHAGWVNKLTFGIENRNAGPLRRDGDQWYWWPDNWSAVFPADKLGKVPRNFGGRWWEPYTYGQVCANIQVGQMLYCRYPQMDPRWFLPHSATSGGKYDTGPAYPLGKVREAVFSQRPLEDLFWLHDYRADPQYMEDYAEEEDEAFLRALALRQKDRFDDPEEDMDMVEEPPRVDLQELVENGAWKKKLGAVRRALHKLGYSVPASADQELDDDTALAVYQFQRSMKLKADKIPGSKETQPALMKRLAQFGLA